MPVPVRPGPLGLTPTRRQFLAALGIAVVGVACTKSSNPGGGSSTGGGGSGTAAAGSIGTLRTGATELSLLSSNTPVNPGKQRFGFDLSTSDGGLVTGGSPQVWLATDETSKALGPFAATWFAFTAYEETGDTSPKSPLPGTYAVELDIPSPGNWIVAAEASNGSQRAVGLGALPVTDGDVPAMIGSKATSVKTPVATTESKLEEICTRKPPDHMHYVSLDVALNNGKPTVVSFATPLLCESQLCGPVVDEQILVFQDVGAAKANFIHAEEFLPGPSKTPPAPTLENASPAFRAWKFDSEPWVVVIDSDGVIQARFEGPVVAQEIKAALEPLL